MVLLAGGMSGREARRYVETRLAYGGARPELVAAFDDATIDALHRASQGVPRRLNQAAEDVVRRATRAPTAAAALRTGAGVAPAPPAPEIVPAPPAAAAARARRARSAAARAVAAPPEPAGAPPPDTRGAASGAADPCARPTLAARAADAGAPACAGSADRRRAPPSRASRARRRTAASCCREIFDRAPGEPAGEYRIVRGRSVAELAGGRAIADAGREPGARETVLVAPRARRPCACAPTFRSQPRHRTARPSRAAAASDAADPR